MTPIKEKSLIRIKKIVIDNYRNIQHGEISLDRYPDKSDILGLYGQNGSGKSTFVRAISFLKYIITGNYYPDGFFTSDDINKTTGSDHSSFSYVFTYRNNNSEYDITYSIDVEAKNRHLSNNSLPPQTQFRSTAGKTPYLKHERMVVKNINGNYRKVFEISDRRTSNNPLNCFGPKNAFDPIWVKASFLPEYIDETMTEGFTSVRFMNVLEEYISDNSWNGKSLIFNLILDLKIDKEDLMDEPLIRIISDFNNWGRNNLSIITPENYGAFSLPYVDINPYPNSEKDKTIIKHIEQFSPISSNLIPQINSIVEGVGTFVSSILPDFVFGVDFKKMFSISNTEEFYDEAEQAVAYFYSERCGQKIDINHESDGIKRLLSFAQSYISAFNDCSYTLVIDELDSGIFEYLLGQLLTIFEEDGKGQLIFTCHNLRPLEVINNSHIYFTTTNPAERYIQFKGLKPSHNLRNQYLKAVQTNDKNIEVYYAKQQFRIIDSLLRSQRQLTNSFRKKAIQRPLTKEEKDFLERIKNREYIVVDEIESTETNNE